MEKAVKSINYGPDGKIESLVLDGKTRKTWPLKRTVLDRQTVRVLKKNRKEMDEFTKVRFLNPEIDEEVYHKTAANIGNKKFSLVTSVEGALLGLGLGFGLPIALIASLPVFIASGLYSESFGPYAQFSNAKPEFHPDYSEPSEKFEKHEKLIGMARWYAGRKGWKERRNARKLIKKVEKLSELDEVDVNPYELKKEIDEIWRESSYRRHVRKAKEGDLISGKWHLRKARKLNEKHELGKNYELDRKAAYAEILGL